MGRILEPEVMEGPEEAAAYDELERRYGEILFQGFAESALRMGVVAGRVLDVGTGPGWIPIRLAKLNPAFVIDAIDLSRSMLELAERNARGHGVDGRIRFSVGDAKQLPFEDHSFDLVLCHNMLHQLPDPLVVLKEINRVAKLSGAILVRDVRRLPGPLMELALPLYCLRYSAGLRRLTYSSFRAGLTYREFATMVRSSGIERAAVRKCFITHLGLERPARPYEPPQTPAAAPNGSPLVRLMRSPYVSRPRR